MITISGAEKRTLSWSLFVGSCGGLAAATALKIIGRKSILSGSLASSAAFGALAYAQRRYKRRSIEPYIPREKVPNPEQWKAHFKANAIKNFAARGREPQSSVELTSEQRGQLERLLEKYGHVSGEEQGVTIYGRQDIFSVDSIPGIIFRTEDEEEIQRRIQDHNRAADALKQYNLDLLHLPDQKLDYIDIVENGVPKKIPILIETKFEVLHEVDFQQAILRYCINDNELRPFAKEILRQLIIFVCKAGYWDVRGNNNPFLSSGQGIGLIDTKSVKDPSDKSFNPLTWLKCGGTQFQQTAGLLTQIPPDLLDELKETLQAELSEEQWQQLNFDQIRQDNAARFKLDEVYRQTPERLNRNPIDFWGWAFWKEWDAEKLVELEREVNGMIADSPGIWPPSERCTVIHFYHDRHCKDLDLLKQNGKIVDYQKCSPATDAFYYVWF